MHLRKVFLLGILAFMTSGHTLKSAEFKSAGSILPILVERHSGRSYDDSKPVTADQISTLIEAARSAPSCYNDQPWFFIICDRSTQSETYQKVLDSLVEFNQGWAKHAPLLVIVAANSKFGKNQKPNRWGSYDTGAAASNMMLQASYLGLMAHQMGGFDENRIREDFNIPEGITPMSVMAIGYEKAGEKIPERDRKPVPENFFFGRWSPVK